MLAIPIFQWPQAISQVVGLAVEKCVLQPIHGLAALLTGANLMLPPLCHAASRAAAEAICRQLTATDAVAIQQGSQRIVDGFALLAWPLVIAVTVLSWHAPVLVQVMLAVVLLGFPL